jgi:hypothetical protein
METKAAEKIDNTINDKHGFILGIEKSFRTGTIQNFLLNIWQ